MKHTDKTKREREMKVKQLKWKKVKPEVFEDWSWKAQIYGLFLNNEPAYYQVHQMHGQEITASVWYGNRAFNIGDNYKHYQSFEEARVACQKHYSQIIFGNLI